MKQLLILFIATITLVACKKKEEKQYSVWYFDGKEIRTNNVEYLRQSKVNDRLVSNDKDYRFDIVFGYGAPHDTIPVYGITRSQYGVRFYVYHNKKIVYRVQEEEQHHLIHSKVDGKSRYTLDPAWFTHTDSLGGIDSVLIWGEFNEP